MVSPKDVNGTNVLTEAELEKIEQKKELISLFSARTKLHEAANILDQAHNVRSDIKATDEEFATNLARIKTEMNKAENILSEVANILAASVADEANLIRLAQDAIQKSSGLKLQRVEELELKYFFEHRKKMANLIVNMHDISGVLRAWIDIPSDKKSYAKLIQIVELQIKALETNNRLLNSSIYEIKAMFVMLASAEKISQKQILEPASRSSKRPWWRRLW